jgi:hypothetical protein
MVASLGTDLALRPMAEKSFEERVTILEQNVGSKSLEDRFRAQAELIKRLLDEKFREEAELLDRRFLLVDQRFTSVDEQLAVLTRDVAIIRDGVGILLKRS